MTAQTLKVGFIGLGTMGQPMAANLLKADIELFVYDTDATAMDVLTATGATAARSVADIADRADVLFTSLPGPVEVEAVTLGVDGIASRLREGLVLFDLSTSVPALCRRIHDVFATRGAFMLDAPVSGGPSGAAAAKLGIWVGGDQPTFNKHVDLLQILGDSPLYVGDVGFGTIAKLAHNLANYVMLQALAEAFSMAVKAGMDPLDLWKALRVGSVGRMSPLDKLTDQFLPGTYDSPTFTLKLAHKDVTLATALARELGVPMPLSDLTMGEMTEALGQGLGAEDSRAFMKLQTARAGVEVAVDPSRLKAALDAS